MYAKKLQGFTLFEVLLAWSLFMLVVTAVAIAQTRALAALREAYLKEVVAIQLLNIKNRFIALQDNKLRKPTYNIWHKHNKELLTDVDDSYNCAAGSCCVTLNWRQYRFHECM